MAQQRKDLDLTATTNADGDVVLNGEIPSGWEYVCAHGTGQDLGVSVPSVRRTGSNQLKARVLDPADGTKVANTQVHVAVQIVGNN
jgi:hypothetical protein